MKKVIGLVFIGFLFSGILFAQESKSAESDAKKTETVKLSIEEAVEYALKNSRTLKSSDIDLELKERAAKNSWNVFLPDISASGTMMRASEISPQYAAAGLDDYPDEESRWDVVGKIGASWTFAPAYIVNIKKAKVEYENGKITWEQTQRETITNIKKHYYRLLLQQESLKIKKTSLENARQRMNQAATNFKNGAIPEIQYLQTQVNYENTKPEVDSAEQDLVQQIDMLAFMIGMPVGTKIELTSSIEPTFVEVDADELLAEYSGNNLKIQALEKNKLAAKLGVTAGDMSTWIPSLVVNYAWNPMYMNGSQMGVASGNAKAFGFAGDIGDDEKWYNSGNLTLTLAWNLTNMLPWSKTRQQVKDGKQQLAKLEISIETAKENQKVEVRKAVDTLNQAREQIDSMARNVTVAQRAYDMSVRSYRNGTMELLDLRDAESSLNQAKLGYVTQKFQYISALMDLENTLNTDLTK